ncbi:MAG TPA: hypothetical protein VF631_10550 [Allosphingosinicella sp.]|uniref:hypothetical protein n=1 Tax=Allosphingosinicella sp. TaxID=2823234 RepID=UPI002F2A4485
MLTFAFGDVRFFTPAFVIVLLIGALLGLPIYFLIRSRGEANWRTAAATGFFAGAAIPALVMLSGPPDSASIDGVATVMDGSYTWFGWFQNLSLVGLFGGAGSAAGLFFLRFVGRAGVPTVAEEQVAPTKPSWKPAALTVAAIATVGAAVAIPEVTKDRSCHNTLRDGRRSIGQEASFNLMVGTEEWRAVAQEVEAFGREKGWSIISDVRPDESFQWFQISMCQEPGTNILVQGSPEFREVSFGVYQPQAGTSWRVPFVELYTRIWRRWPDRIEFTGDVGQQIEPPRWVPTDQKTGAGKPPAR